MPSRFTVLHRRRGDVEVKSANHRPGERCIVASAAIPEVIHPDVSSPSRTLVPLIVRNPPSGRYALPGSRSLHQSRAERPEAVYGGAFAAIRLRATWN